MRLMGISPPHEAKKKKKKKTWENRENATLSYAFKLCSLAKDLPDF